VNFLFIHQNFPGQFRHLAPALAAQGHRVIALMIQSGAAVSPQNWQGVQVLPYRVEAKNTPGLHPWLTDMETKLLRADACWRAMRALRDAGWVPDAVIAHPGWGEPLFVKQVWPDTRLGVYAEFFYRLHGADVGFDPEFAPPDAEADGCRLQMKNLNHLAHLDQADGALSPTRWQADTFPPFWRERIAVAHDGIDTKVLCPDSSAKLTWTLPRTSEARSWTRDDEVITYVARHLEPYRGFHIFMRALPALLQRRPNAQVLIVGEDGTGYGSAAPAGTIWREVFTSEVRSRIPDSDWARVHFLGRLDRDAFTSLLKLSRVHVYLSYPFVLSWSLIEAMSVGASIVASDTAPVREVITDGEQGRLVDFFEHQALVEVVNDLLDRPGERQRLGEAARAVAQSRYDLGSVCLPLQIRWALGLANER
jgi:glycosyltransferase involved in cell wall biosynthesis